jgi:hypothetical protein
MNLLTLAALILIHSITVIFTLEHIILVLNMCFILASILAIPAAT